MTYSENARQRFGRYALKKWDTPDTYDPNYREVPNKSGIYMLLGLTLWYQFKAEIVYVGSSTDLKSRFTHHNVLVRLRKEKSFDAVAFVFKQMDTGFYDAEISLIRRLNPPMNKLLYGIKIH